MNFTQRNCSELREALLQNIEQNWADAELQQLSNEEASQAFL